MFEGAAFTHSLAAAAAAAVETTRERKLWDAHVLHVNYEINCPSGYLRRASDQEKQSAGQRCAFGSTAMQAALRHGTAKTLLTVYLLAAVGSCSGSSLNVNHNSHAIRYACVPTSIRI